MTQFAQLLAQAQAATVKAAFYLVACVAFFACVVVAVAPTEAMLAKQDLINQESMHHGNVR